jgi:hypothetical protein
VHKPSWRRGRLFNSRLSESIHDSGSLKMLRFDVTNPDRIPADNSFVGSEAEPAIWAYGLHNPWRCTYDWRRIGLL